MYMKNPFLKVLKDETGKTIIQKLTSLVLKSSYKTVKRNKKLDRN